MSLVHVRRWCAAVVAAVATATAWPGPVRACMCSTKKLDGGRLYLGRDALLPASAVGVPWRGPTPLVKSRDRVKLWRVEAGRPTPVKFKVVAQGEHEFIVPRAPLRPGDRYLVAVREELTAHALKGLWESGQRDLEPVYAAAEVVIGEGTLEMAGLELRATRRGRQRISVGTDPWAMREAVVTMTSCRFELDAEVVDVEVVLPPALEPYRAYFQYRTQVDGQAWAPRRHNCDRPDVGRSWAERVGTDVWFEPCGDAGGTVTRRIEVIVSAPGGEVLASAAKDVVITCAPRTSTSAAP